MVILKSFYINRLNRALRTATIITGCGALKTSTFKSHKNLLFTRNYSPLAHRWTLRSDSAFPFVFAFWRWAIQSTCTLCVVHTDPLIVDCFSDATESNSYCCSKRWGGRQSHVVDHWREVEVIRITGILSGVKIPNGQQTSTTNLSSVY